MVYTQKRRRGPAPKTHPYRATAQPPLCYRPDTTLLPRCYRWATALIPRRYHFGGAPGPRPQHRTR